MRLNVSNDTVPGPGSGVAGYPVTGGSRSLCRIVLSGASLAIVLAALGACTVPRVAAANEVSTVDLMREDQNPITRFYVMRFEDNAQLGFGPDDEVVNYFRIQPLVPFDLGEDWRLLARAVIPVAHVPWPETADGLSDIGLLLFLTPSRADKLVWGVGPGVLLPTATDDRLGTEKWSAGPAAALVYLEGPWVVGAVAQNLWSFAGDSDRRDVNLMTLRPLVNYNLPDGWYLSSSPSIAANWEADGGDRWLVPLGGGVGKVFAIGGQRMSLLVESYYHVVSPEVGPDWQLRVQLSFLYPD